MVASWAAREVGNRQDCNEFSSGAAITTVLMPPPGSTFTGHDIAQPEYGIPSGLTLEKLVHSM